jgi:hypothetical protein
LAVGLSLVIAGFVLYVIFNKKSGC